MNREHLELKRLNGRGAVLILILMFKRLFPYWFPKRLKKGLGVIFLFILFIIFPEEVFEPLS
jgi:hypothetical protein